MDTSEQLKFIEDKIQEYIILFERKRQVNKYLSFGIKLSAALMAALITIILGVTFKDKPENAYKNAALILGALITVFNTWDAFFNHKALWVRFTIAMSRLYSLKNTISYLKTKPVGQITEVKLDSLYEELQKIISETNSNWEELRKEESNVGNR
jgi:hypothetical protein